jgi:hypothetical protein
LVAVSQRRGSRPRKLLFFLRPSFAVVSFFFLMFRTDVSCIIEGDDRLLFDWLVGRNKKANCVKQLSSIHVSKSQFAIPV